MSKDRIQLEVRRITDSHLAQYGLAANQLLNPRFIGQGGAYIVLASVGCQASLHGAALSCRFNNTPCVSPVTSSQIAF